MAGKKGARKKVFIILGILLLAAAAVTWYLFTLKFEDTDHIKPDFSVQAKAFIQEFEKDGPVANKKYADKMVEVTGIVSALEKADTSLNLKMVEPSTGSYIIFAFQAKDANAAKDIKEGEQVVVKGACSGSMFSEILEVHSINFTRSVLVQSSQNK